MKRLYACHTSDHTQQHWWHPTVMSQPGSKFLHHCSKMKTTGGQKEQDVHGVFSDSFISDIWEHGQKGQNNMSSQILDMPPIHLSCQTINPPTSSNIWLLSSKGTQGAIDSSQDDLLALPPITLEGWLVEVFQSLSSSNQLLFSGCWVWS